jgi:hypothetical protein
MRNYVLGFTLAISGAISASAYAQTAESTALNTFHACTTTDPASNEVFIFSNGNFGGTCAALGLGLYPYSGTTHASWPNDGRFGLPNDSISSLKVGSAVRARLFSDGMYGGNFTWFSGFGAFASMPSGWNDVTSSIRVEDNTRSPTCNDLRSGEFALFREPNFIGECIVLPYGAWRSQPENLGIANDSVSSINGGPPFAPPSISCPDGGPANAQATLHADAYWGGAAVANAAGQVRSALPGFDNALSSIDIQYFCRVN